MKLIHHTIVAVLLALTVASCGSSRTAATAPAAGASYTWSKDADKVVKEMAAAWKPEWVAARVPVTLALESPSRISLKATMTMVRGRAIALSVRALGFEVASVTVVGDSIWVIEKLHRNYVAESIPELLNGFPANVANLQDMLIGRPFVLGEASLPGAAVNSLALNRGGESGEWTITPQSPAPGIDYHFDIGSGTPAGVVSSLVASILGNKASASYSDFAVTAIGPVATTASLAVPLGNKKLAAMIYLEGSKLKSDPGLTIERPSVKGYSRMNARDLLKALSSSL